MKIHILCTEIVILSVKCSTYEVGVEKSIAKLSNSHLPTSALIQLPGTVWWYLKVQLPMNLEWILRKHKSLCKQDLQIFSWNTTQTVKTLRAVSAVNNRNGVMIHLHKFYLLRWLDSLSALVPWQLVTERRTHSQANHELPNQRICILQKLGSQEAYTSLHCMCLTTRFGLHTSVNSSL